MSETTNNCGNCAKWLAPWQGNVHGYCNKIQGMEFAAVFGLPAAVDATGEAEASMRTSQEFGCVLHEPRKEQS